MFKKEQEMELINFLENNKLIYNKRLMDYKDPNEPEAIWDILCRENNMVKATSKGVVSELEENLQQDNAYEI